MSIVKIVSLVLLAIFLILNGLVDLMGLQLHAIAHFILGLIAIVSGILMLLSSSEFYHYTEE